MVKVDSVVSDYIEPKWDSQRVYENEGETFDFVKGEDGLPKGDISKSSGSESEAFS